MSAQPARFGGPAWNTNRAIECALGSTAAPTGGNVAPAIAWKGHVRLNDVLLKSSRFRKGVAGGTGSGGCLRRAQAV